MAWIATIPAPEWDGEFAQYVDEVIDHTSGHIDNIMQVHSLNPASLFAHNTLYRSAMSGTATLRKVDRELVAFVVSQVNECHY